MTSFGLKAAHPSSQANHQPRLFPLYSLAKGAPPLKLMNLCVQDLVQQISLGPIPTSTVSVVGSRRRDELGTENGPPEIPGQPPLSPLPSGQSRQGSASTQPDEAPKSRGHPSGVKPSAPGGSLPASSGPDTQVPGSSNDSTLQIRHRLELDELWHALSPASGKRSKTVDDFDCTGQLTERTKPKFQGKFSDVSKAKLGDRVVAVKALRLTNTEGDEESRMWKRLGREIYVWAALDHPNVLELLGFAFEDEIPCLISPWCENGTVKKYLQNFPNANRRRLVREIAEGLKYLHLQPIVHGDFKPVGQGFHSGNKIPKTDNVSQTNICVTDKHVARICDFGTSRRVEEIGTGFTTGSFSFTTRYSAPEILRDGLHSTLSSDVFSFAYVALGKRRHSAATQCSLIRTLPETMSGEPPFYKIQKDVALIHHVVNEKETPSPEDHPGVEAALWELLRRCWKYEPPDRPEMIDVCETVHLSLPPHMNYAFLTTSGQLAEAGYGPATTPEGAT
ncbi:hypothetical protein FS837_012786 [Tulasnella sp. UAMH 9824]|nr:hypothetical protein FS837_012786 [Tulasnella sp. UAMH 9824]